MTLRTSFATALATSALFLSALAHAHDPSLHGDFTPPPIKAKPEICEPLADDEHYSNNMGDPDIKALQNKCDAERKASGEPIPR